MSSSLVLGKRPAPTSPNDARPSKRRGQSPEEGEVDDSRQHAATSKATESDAVDGTKKAGVKFPFKKKLAASTIGPTSILNPLGSAKDKVQTSERGSSPKASVDAEDGRGRGVDAGSSQSDKINRHRSSRTKGDHWEPSLDNSTYPHRRRDSPSGSEDGRHERDRKSFAGRERSRERDRPPYDSRDADRPYKRLGYDDRGRGHRQSDNYRPDNYWSNERYDSRERHTPREYYSDRNRHDHRGSRYDDRDRHRPYSYRPSSPGRARPRSPPNQTPHIPISPPPPRPRSPPPRRNSRERSTPVLPVEPSEPPPKNPTPPPPPHSPPKNLPPPPPPPEEKIKEPQRPLLLRPGAPNQGHAPPSISLPKPVPNLPPKPLVNVFEQQHKPAPPTAPASKIKPKRTLAPRRTRKQEENAFGHVFSGCGDPDDYDITTKLGEGTFGEVHKAIHKPTQRMVALKRILMHNEKEGMPVTALREIKILKALKHPNIIQLLDMLVVRSNDKDPLTVTMVFPYMDHDLAGLLDNDRVKLQPSQIKLYMKQLLEGTEYMHRNHILHRDMKAANLLISNDGNLRIADFGLARAFDSKPDFKGRERKYTNCVVTRWYRPPELLLGARQYGGEVDIWGIGCVLGEMFTRRPILPGSSDVDQLERIWHLCGTPSQHSWPNYDHLPGCEGLAQIVPGLHSRIATQFNTLDSLDSVTIDLLEQLLTLNPVHRITAAKALDHDYFWTDPLPADPKSLIAYEASHELDKRGQRMPYQAPQHHQPRPPQHGPPNGRVWGAPPPGVPNGPAAQRGPPQHFPGNNNPHHNPGYPQNVRYPNHNHNHNQGHNRMHPPLPVGPRNGQAGPRNSLPLNPNLPNRPPSGPAFRGGGGGGARGGGQGGKALPYGPAN